MSHRHFNLNTSQTEHLLFTQHCSFLGLTKCREMATPFFQLLGQKTSVLSLAPLPLKSYSQLISKSCLFYLQTASRTRPPPSLTSSPSPLTTISHLLTITSYHHLSPPHHHLLLPSLTSYSSSSSCLCFFLVYSHHSNQIHSVKF